MEGLRRFASVSSRPARYVTDPVITGTSPTLREASLPSKPQPLPATSNADVRTSRAVRAREVHFLEPALIGLPGGMLVFRMGCWYP